MDLDTILGVLAVVPITVITVHMLVAGTRGIPLVKTLGTPVLIRVSGTIIVVSVATSGVVGKSGLVRRLSLPLVQTLGAPVLVRVAGTILVVSIATSGVVGKSGLVRRLSLPLVQ